MTHDTLINMVRKSIRAMEKNRVVIEDLTIQRDVTDKHILVCFGRDPEHRKYVSVVRERKGVI